jgi:hypothetical protein
MGCCENTGAKTTTRKIDHKKNPPRKSDTGSSAPIETKHTRDVYDIPRYQLERYFTDTLRDIDNGDDSKLDVYSKILDRLHKDFDFNDVNSILEGFNRVKRYDVESIPRRERRELVHILTRASPHLLRTLRSDRRFTDLTDDDRSKLFKIVDRDVLQMGESIAELIEDDQSKRQTYVIGHNEIPIIIKLLKGNSRIKLQKYFEFKRTYGTKGSSLILKRGIDGKDSLWDMRNTHSEPFVSESGNTTIYASVPFRDFTTFFKSWLKELEPNDGQMYLAPTDDVIVTYGLDDKLRNADKSEIRSFVERYRIYNVKDVIKKLNSPADKARDMDVRFEISGKKIDLPLNTNIQFNASDKKGLVPIYTLM